MESEKRSFYLYHKVSKLRMLRMAENMSPSEAEKRNEWLQKFASSNLIWIQDESELETSRSDSYS